MTLRVVVHCEGMGDGGGEDRHLPPPGEALSDDQLGAAHFILRRALSSVRGIPEGAIRFDAPLVIKGRRARGSDLLDRTTLRRLVTYPRREMEPELIVVLVDGDGSGPERIRRLHDHLDGLPRPPVVAVIEPEFEGWLIADHVAAGEAVSRTFDTPPHCDNERSSSFARPLSALRET